MHGRVLLQAARPALPQVRLALLVAEPLVRVAAGGADVAAL